MPVVVERVIRRQRAQPLEPVLVVVKKTKATEFPEPGAIEELFREARKQRA
jgi:hypothetical protein